jgi:hypothetical protein
MVLPHSQETGKVPSTYAVLRMTLVWMPSCPALQCHVAEVHVKELGVQLKVQHEIQACKALVKVFVNNFQLPVGFAVS